MMFSSKPILVTGVAGFIGFHLAKRLLREGHSVIGIDSLNDYYDVNLKKARLAQLEEQERFAFKKLNIADRRAMELFFQEHSFDYVMHLAAQAGVRYSLENPHAYVDSNLIGYVNILEGCRHNKVKHLIYASSSSVYGGNTKMPFSEQDNVDHPISLYAATKKSNELMAHTYAHLYDIPVTGLRFFTVYGPWGRPDMALFLFTKAIREGRPIEVYNHGEMRRDFTYIDDIVEGVIRIGQKPPLLANGAPYEIYNIGNNKPVELMRMIEILESELGIKAEKKMMAIQPGDVPETYADIDGLFNAVGFRPKTSLEDGIQRFVQWYNDFYGEGTQ